MKIKRFGIFLVLLGLLVGVVSGCQPQFQPGSYIDDMGRAVTIDEVPQRIVSFGPSITEILFALGLDEKIVGVDDFSDYPEAAKSKPKIGNAFSPSLETVVELEPDLVLTVKHEQLNSQLEALGIKFMVIDPQDIDGILADIELLGKITGTEKRARELVEDMRAVISQVRSQVEGARPVSVFFVVDGTDPNNPWTAGPGSFIDALITMAGGDNVAGEAVGAWVQFSIEQVVSSNPEIIIVQTITAGVPTIATEVLEQHPGWRETDAVKQGNILLINGDLTSRPGPRIVQGLEELAKIIHPELFD